MFLLWRAHLVGIQAKTSFTQVTQQQPNGFEVTVSRTSVLPEGSSEQQLDDVIKVEVRMQVPAAELAGVDTAAGIKYWRAHNDTSSEREGDFEDGASLVNIGRRHVQTLEASLFAMVNALSWMLGTSLGIGEAGVFFEIERGGELIPIPASLTINSRLRWDWLHFKGLHDLWGMFWNERHMAEEDVKAAFGVVPLLRDEHRLWLEANFLASSSPVGGTSHAEATLILTVTALETCLKRTIAAEAPQTLWLLENSSSPPLLSLAKIYLPELGVYSLDDEQDTKRAIQEAIELRNKITHGASSWKRTKNEDWFVRAAAPRFFERSSAGVRRILLLVDKHRGWIDADRVLAQTTVPERPAFSAAFSAENCEN